MASSTDLPVAVLDTSVLVAAAHPGLGRVAPDLAATCSRLLSQVDFGAARAYLSAPILSEVAHVLARNGVGMSARSRLFARWGSMSGRLDVVSLDAAHAIQAGEYRQAHYHRERLPLSYIDCFCVVLAQQLNAPLVTLEETLQRAPEVTAVTPARFLADHGL